jgi:hypothetical protein
MDKLENEAHTFADESVSFIKESGLDPLGHVDGLVFGEVIDPDVIDQFLDLLFS